MDCNRSVTNPAVSLAFIRRSIMSNNLLIASVASLGLVLSALASDRAHDIGRIQKAARVFHEIMSTPDKAIPQDLLETTKSVATVPGTEKLPSIFAGTYGKA